MMLELTIPSWVFWIWLLSLRFLLFSSRSVILLKVKVGIKVVIKAVINMAVKVCKT